MIVKNEDTTDEVIKLLESSGITLTDNEKETLRKHREAQQQRQESMGEEYQRAQLVHLCKHLGVSGRALIQRSLNSYLAMCRRTARNQGPKIDIQQIYYSRRAF
jgi:hypothetical protein